MLKGSDVEHTEPVAEELPHAGAAVVFAELVVCLFEGQSEFVVVGDFVLFLVFVLQGEGTCDEQVAA